MAARKKALHSRPGAIIRISVGLHEEVHLRLRSHVLVRRTTVQDLVVALIEREVASTRLPSVGRDPAESPDRAEDPA